MLVFRSEEHVDRWARDWGLPRGGLLSLEQCWQLARAWYAADRRRPDWRRLTLDEAEARLGEIGLTGAFWRLRA
jgi:hypothetical protein